VRGEKKMPSTSVGATVGVLAPFESPLAPPHQFPGSGHRARHRTRRGELRCVALP
jgi:hypothetical protein